MKQMLLTVCLFFWSYAFASPIHYPHVSSSEAAQKSFDKGMLTYYAYSYIQAEYSFKQALIYDPKCGMCFWGLAIAKKQQALELGLPFATRGLEEINKAMKFINPANSFQYDVAKATLNSFSSDPHASAKQLQLNYMEALKKVYDKYKNNQKEKSEALALYLDAIAYYPKIEDKTAMNHCNYNLNDHFKDEALTLLTPFLKDLSCLEHPGLLHTYIHLTENELKGPWAEKVAKKMATFAQGTIAHYAHMPTHIYWRQGEYDKAIAANLSAIEIDKNYFKQNGAGLNSYYYEYHYLHSYHFLTVLGVLTNNPKLAIENAKAIKELMDVNHIKRLKDYKDIFFSLEHLVRARFNQWPEVLDLKIPPNTQKLGYLFINFSQALAYLHLGKTEQFDTLYQQIKETNYSQSNMREFQTLILTYLDASNMNLAHKSLKEMNELFLKNHVDQIENKLKSSNPPLWFFSYELFLSQAALERNNPKEAHQYQLMYEKMFPKSH